MRLLIPKKIQRRDGSCGGFTFFSFRRFYKSQIPKHLFFIIINNTFTQNPWILVWHPFTKHRFEHPFRRVVFVFIWFVRYPMFFLPVCCRTTHRTEMSASSRAPQQPRPPGSPSRTSPCPGPRPPTPHRPSEYSTV